MSAHIQANGGDCIGRHNATADTVYYAIVKPKKGHFTRVMSMSLTSGNTANNGYWMRPLGRANVATAVAADAGATLTLDADPSPTGNTIAAGDQVIYEGTDGTYRKAQVNTSGWNGTTKVVTFTANVANAVAVGAKVFNFGIFSDTDTATNLVHSIFQSVVNTRQSFVFYGGGVKGNQPGDPLLFYCPNATNATVLDYADFIHSVE